MALEIERKFLVTDCSYRDLATSHCDIMQGYLSADPSCTVRVRLKGDAGFITVKGLTRGCTRHEWEFPIDAAAAREMLTALCPHYIDKTRYLVSAGELTWEVDEFHGPLQGLVVAEVELPSADTGLGTLPPFVGREVTDDARYYNSQLASATAPPQ